MYCDGRDKPVGTCMFLVGMQALILVMISPLQETLTVMTIWCNEILVMNGMVLTYVFASKYKQALNYRMALTHNYFMSHNLTNEFK